MLSSRKYPWRLGATSFVIPALVAENVEYLANRVDDIQLLFFESSFNAKLPNDIDYNFLCQKAQDCDLTYTVHLPLDLRLGANSKAKRLQAISEVERLVEESAIITPQAFDLHLNMEDIPLDLWLKNIAESLAGLQQLLGDKCQRIAIENIDYDFRLIYPLLQEYDFSLCLDFGHLFRYNYHEDYSWFVELLTQCKHIHLHGVSGGNDHIAIEQNDKWVKLFGGDLSRHNWQGVVTLELYKQQYFLESISTIDLLWRDHRNNN